MIVCISYSAADVSQLDLHGAKPVQGIAAVTPRVAELCRATIWVSQVLIAAYPNLFLSLNKCDKDFGFPWFVEPPKYKIQKFLNAEIH